MTNSPSYKMLSRRIYSVLRGYYRKSGIERISLMHHLINSYIGGNIVDFIGARKGFRFKKGDNLGYKLHILFKWYEAKTVEDCKRLIQPGMNVLDIGANIGYYTCLFSKLVGPKGMVYAFEPVPENYKVLIKNICSLKYQNVIPIQKGISNYIGQAEFYRTKESGLGGFYGSGDILEKISVEVTTIDAFLTNYGNASVEFIKMDIEGGEPKALEGMSQTIKKSNHLDMIVELNPKTLLRTGFSPQKFLSILDSLGFNIKVIEELPDGSSNLLCQKII